MGMIRCGPAQCPAGATAEITPNIGLMTCNCLPGDEEAHTDKPGGTIIIARESAGAAAVLVDELTIATVPLVMGFDCLLMQLIPFFERWSSHWISVLLMHVSTVINWIVAFMWNFGVIVWIVTHGFMLEFVFLSVLPQIIHSFSEVMIALRSLTLFISLIAAVAADAPF